MRHANRCKPHRLRPVLEQMEDRITPSIGLYLHPDSALTPQIAPPSSGYDSNTTVTMDAAGHVAAFWQNSLPGASSPVIRGEVNGSAVFTVSSAGTIDAAASDTSGDVAVAWQTQNSTAIGISYSSYLSVYSSTGVPQGGPILLGNSYDSGSVSVAGDNAGHFLVAWEGTGIQGQVFDAHGNALTSAFIVTSGQASQQMVMEPAVAADQGGGFVVLWQTVNLPSQTTGGIDGQRYDAMGNAVGTSFVVYANTNPNAPQADSLRVASDGAGNLVAVWSLSAWATDWHYSWPAFEGIEGQRFTDQGVLQGGVFKINNTPYPAGTPEGGAKGGEPIVPGVALDGAGYVEVTIGTYAERFNAANHSIGALFPLTAMDGPVTLAGDTTGDVVFGGTQSGDATAMAATGSNINHAPTSLAPIAAGDQVAYVGMQYTESQSYFRDPDGDPLTYKATLADGSPLPSWLQIYTSGQLSGTPPQSAAGTTIQVKVTATDPYWSNASLVLPLQITATPSTGPGIVLKQTLTAPYGSPDPGHDSSPILTVDGSGRLGMFWQDPAPAGGTISGEITGSPTFPVATQATSLLAAAADTNGDIAVVWADAAGNGYISFVSSTGASLGGPVLVLNGLSYYVPAISLAGDSVGHFMMTWGGYGGIFAEVFDAHGSVVTSAFAVPNDFYPGTDSWDSNPVVVADSAGNFMVLWADFEPGYDPSIWAQRYDANGGGLNRFVVVTLQYPPDSVGIGGNLSLGAASDGAGHVVVIWTGDTFADGQEPGSSSGTFSTAPAFERITDQGSVNPWGSIPVDATPPAASNPTAYSTPAVALDASANLDVVYNSGNTTYAKRFDASNTVVAPLNYLTAVAPSPASMVALPNGDFAIGSLTAAGNAAAAIYTSGPAPAPPTVVTPVAAADQTAFANVVYDESQSYFTNAAGSLLTYTATLANGSPLPAWLTLSANGVLSGIPGPGVVGTAYQVCVTATDPYGGSAVLTLPITVAADPTQPNGSALTVAPVTVGASPAASNAWTGQPAVAVNAAGDAMIVGGMSTTGGEVIMGQVYNAQHQPLGSVFQVNRTVGGTGNSPIITADAAGDFDVAWQAGTVAYWQRFSPLGVAVGAPITLAAEQGLQMVADAAGDLILLWTGADGGIYVRRFDMQGNKLTPTVEVAAIGGGYQAAASPSGNVMVVWNTNQQAYTRLYTAQLAPLTAATPIGIPGVDSTDAVAADGLGNFDVALESGNTIEFARFNNLGKPIANAQGGTGPTAVAAGPGVAQNYNPQVVADRSGNFTIIWSSYISPNNYDLGQRYDPTGRPVGGVFLIPIGGAPLVAGDPAGDLLATDLQGRNLGGQWYWPTATVHVPAAQSTSLTSTLVFSTANHNAITLTAGNPAQAETLTLTTGSAATLTVTGTTGLASISGNGTATIKLTGTSAVLNAALQGLTFHPVSSALNPTLQLTLAPNTTMSVSGSVPIHTVAAQNVPPKVAMPTGSLSVAGGSKLVFSTAHADAITLTDPDAGSTLETLTLYVTSGTLKLGSTSGVHTVSGNGTGDVRVTGTLIALNTALSGLVYTPAAGAKGSVSFNVYVVDNANAMGWASLALSITP